MLRYAAGDWNALHRDLYGEMVFPLQVVINLNEPGIDRVFFADEATAVAAGYRPRAVCCPDRYPAWHDTQQKPTGIR